MARRKGRTGTATNLYLDSEVKRQALKLAFRENTSLSDIVAVELRKWIARRKKAEARVTANAARNQHAFGVPKNGIGETLIRKPGKTA